VYLLKDLLFNFFKESYLSYLYSKENVREESSAQVSGAKQIQRSRLQVAWNTSGHSLRILAKC